MKNSKLAVMFLTFLVMIALTPLIFSKLMNAKYNSMLNDLRSQGVVIKEIQDKSTYLKTDKIYDVVIPGKLINAENIINQLHLKVETLFNNLPVTDVKFKGNVTKAQLAENFAPMQDDIGSFLKKYVKFTVTTPNFKNYAYRFEDINVKDIPEFGAKTIKGVFQNGTVKKNTLNINDIYLKDKSLLFEIKNFKNTFEGDVNDSYTTSRFNINAKLNRLTANATDVFSKTKTVIHKTLFIDTSLGFNRLIISDAADASGFKLHAQLKGIETELLKKMASAPENEKDFYIEQIFEKGFNINIASNLKNLKISHKDYGYFDMTFNLEFLPTQNIKQKIDNDDIDFVNAKLHLETSPEIAMMLMNALPQSAFLFAFAKKEKGIVKLDIELRSGQWFSEGQPIQ